MKNLIILYTYAYTYIYACVYKAREGVYMHTHSQEGTGIKARCFCIISCITDLLYIFTDLSIYF